METLPKQPTEKLEAMVRRVKHAELEPIRQEVSRLADAIESLVRQNDRKNRNLIPTRQCAALFGMRPRAWVETYVHTEAIHPAHGHKSLYERQKVERLLLREKSKRKTA